MAVIDAQTFQRVLSKIDAGELSQSDAAVLFKALAGEIAARCAEDGLFWAKWVLTRDEADPANSVKPFPLHDPYTKTLWNDWHSHQVTVTAKSRQMFVTWAVCAYMVWTARFRSNSAVYFQTQGWDDACEKTAMAGGGYEGRCQFIENHLPEWMRMDIRVSEGRIVYPNGSIIQALAGGANKVRGKTISLYVGDEFAFQDEQDKVWTALAPLVQKGSKVILVSTPNGTMNQFATLYHGRPVGEEQVV